MLNQKRPKTSRQRGSSSHGWGHKKKHRGSGHRGGFGNAGTGARGDSKKPTILTTFGKDYYGKKGFKSIYKAKRDVLSISYLEENFDKLVEGGVIIKEKDEYIFDSTAFKYNKILGNGIFTKKLTIVCEEISDNAKAKIEAAGGKVEILGNAPEEVASEE